MWLFVFTGAVYLLQHVPFVDAVLMILAAMVWPVATVNLGFFGIVIEALAGKVSKFWLVLPICYFGGNIVIATVSHLEFARLEEQVRGFNLGKTTPFTSDDELLLEVGVSHTGPVAQTMAKNYDIPVVFAHDIRNPDRRTIAVRIGAGQLCSTLWNTSVRHASEVRVSNISEEQTITIGSKKKRNDTVDGMCIYSRPETPSGRLARVQFSEPVEHGSFLLPFATQDITVTSASDETVKLMRAEARPLNWIPLPIFGCLRGPGDPERHCFADTLRIFPTTVLGEQGELTVLVARALGLHHAPASTRRAEILKRQNNTM
jgi:hypothetical protein